MQAAHNIKRLEQAISSQEMRLFEKNEFLKKESYFFMKNAGRQAFNLIRKNFKNKQPIIVLCGPGNNGGDGFIIAKYLKSYGYKTEVYASSNKKSYKGDALKALTEYEGKIKKISSFRIRKNALIVDALFGIGLTRIIFFLNIKIFNKINKNNNKVISVDIPSGISSDTGKILGCAIKANYTVTFHTKKLGHLTDPGKKFSGKLKVVDIGFSKKKMQNSFLINSPDLWIKDYPLKKSSDHKYTRGRVVIFGGKKEFTGATILAAEAALRTGSGSVKILCSKDTIQIYSIKFPSVLKTEINNINQLKHFLKKEKITSIHIGPGSGRNKNSKEITKLILRKVKYVVLDADAITCFKNDLKSFYSLLDKNKIITPHMGEFHTVFPDVKKELSNLDKALIAAKLIKSNIILKGANTIIAYKKRLYINSFGTPALSKGGSGDILAGMIGALLAQGYHPLKSAITASLAHSFAGDVSPNYSLTPLKIVENLAKL